MSAQTWRRNTRISEIDNYMVSGRHKLNPDKTDIYGVRRRQRLLNRSRLLLSGAVANSSAVVRVLGVLISTDLSMSEHVNLLVSQYFFSASPYQELLTCALPSEAVQALMKCFVMSQVVFCKSSSCFTSLNNRQSSTHPQRCRETDLRRPEVEPFHAVDTR